MKEKMAMIIMITRCPHCKFSNELNESGTAVCWCCGYHININRYD